MAFAGHKAGHHLRNVSVCQVFSEATHGTLVGTQENPLISEGNDDFRQPLPAPGIQRTTSSLGSVDLPNRYMSSQLAREAVDYNHLTTVVT